MTVHILNDLSFLEGGINDEDVDKAKIAAKEGDAEAQYHLALMFDTGRGVKHNPREAEKWYKASAAQGHTNAQYFLARMYEAETSGIAKNDIEALKWYKEAANQGHIGAKNKVGN